mmetsp:Transcript_10690/g.27212  ORF Transcript_10690/g.27212 Transcript_10690/m.27212 type:complete len:286 (-) Transcript_10690:281-1138(-)
MIFRNGRLDVEAVGNVPLLLVEGLFLGFDEVVVLDLHSSLAEGEEAGLGADGLDVGAGKFVLGHDELLEVDVVGEVHAAGVDAEDVALGLDVGEGEFDLAVDAAGADEGGVEGFHLVGGHDDLDVAALVEAVELVEEFEHGPLDFAGAAGGRVVALGADGVDFVDEDDGRRQVVGDAEEFADELGAVAEVLLDQFAPDDAEEGRRRLVRDGLGQQRLPGPGLAVEDDALGRLDADFLVEFGMGQRQLDGFLDLLDLLLEAADVGVGLQGRLVDLHHRDHGIRVVG